MVCLCFKAGIGIQGLFHDLSKYSFTEFFPGAKYFKGNESPNNGERREKGFSLAWMHHKGRNKHHFEYWYDYEMESKKIVPIPMPDNYIKEMFCDRVAASKIYNKENYSNKAPLLYLVNSTAKEKMHPETYGKILFLLKMLAEQGEAKTLAFIRKIKVIPRTQEF